MAGPAQASLPSVLPPSPAVVDDATTPDDLHAAAARAKVTNPSETPIFICAYQQCYRLFPSRDRAMLHRKRDHDVDHGEGIITWNE